MENKNRLKKWFKKWKWIVIWAIASVIFAIVIQFLFSNPAPCDFLDAKWEAGDILSYVSTVALGLLAMWQNQKMSYDAEKKEKQSRAIEKSIIFDFDEVSCWLYDTGEDLDDKTKAQIKDEGFNGDFAIRTYIRQRSKERINFSLPITNLSDYVATNLKIEKPSNINDCKTNVLHSKDDINNKKYILPHNGGLIKIDFPYSELQDRMRFKLCFSNQFGDKYSQDIIIIKSYDYLIRIETQIILTIENQEEP